MAHKDTHLYVTLGRIPLSHCELQGFIIRVINLRDKIPIPGVNSFLGCRDGVGTQNCPRGLHVVVWGKDMVELAVNTTLLAPTQNQPLARATLFARQNLSHPDPRLPRTTVAEWAPDWLGGAHHVLSQSPSLRASHQVDAVEQMG